MTNTNTSNATVRTTAAAAYFTFDHFNKKIVGTEQNFKKSGNSTTPQYASLMAAMELHPNYALSAIAPKVKKQTYKGLTTDLIREYIEIKGNEAQKAELAELIDNDEAHATIKSWFLDYFKCGFSVEKAKEMIAYHKLSARKSKVRATVKARLVKATPAVVEMPAVSNF